MAQSIDYLPALEGDEAVYIAKMMQPMGPEVAQRFANVYNGRRKDPQNILLMALVGFLGIAGVHRLVLGHMGMGILYLLTGGLCAIGTIVDLFNYKNLAFEYNRDIAREVVTLIS